jgi:hypothetical protein
VRATSTKTLGNPKNVGSTGFSVVGLTGQFVNQCNVLFLEVSGLKDENERV